MAILVTRPQPDNETTAAGLRGKGFAVLLAPVLRFEAVAFQDDPETQYAAVIVSSANALRALDGQLAGSRLLKLPLFAVGERTAETARGAGFLDITVADGNVAALRDLISGGAGGKTLKKGGTLLYLAGADLAGDLAAELGAGGLSVVTHTTYRMVPVLKLPQAVVDAFTANAVDAVLHYSRRSARAFLDAARSAGVEISALAIPQCCISDGVASIIREVGAPQVLVARTPDENGLFEALDRASALSSR